MLLQGISHAIKSVVINSNFKIFDLSTRKRKIDNNPTDEILVNPIDRKYRNRPSIGLDWHLWYNTMLQYDNTLEIVYWSLNAPGNEAK